MGSDDEWASLREAVPSFAPRWQAFVAQPWYDPSDPINVSELAFHLAESTLVRTRGELAPFYRALDALLDGADERLYNHLVIGFLEDFVHEVERHGFALPEVEPGADLPRLRHAWEAVVQYLHPPERQSNVDQSGR